jgi:hypothetical protein
MTTDLVPVETERDPRLCTARSSRHKRPCRRWAMKGQRTCMMHGGKTPAALAKAQEAMDRADLELRRLTPTAVKTLVKLLNAESEAVVLGAARDMLDRGGLKAPDRVEVAASITVTRPW